MGLLTRIESRQSTSTTDRTSMADRPHTSKKQLDVSVDVGKTLAVLVLAALVLVASLVLYLTKANDTAAGAFFAFGEAARSLIRTPRDPVCGIARATHPPCRSCGPPCPVRGPPRPCAARRRAPAAGRRCRGASPGCARKCFLHAMHPAALARFAAGQPSWENPFLANSAFSSVRVVRP